MLFNLGPPYASKYTQVSIFGWKGYWTLSADICFKESVGAAHGKQEDCSKYQLRANVNLDFWKTAYEKGEWHSEWAPGMLLDKTYIVSCKINNSFKNSFKTSKKFKTNTEVALAKLFFFTI